MDGHPKEEVPSCCCRGGSASERDGAKTFEFEEKGPFWANCQLPLSSGPPPKFPARRHASIRVSARAECPSNVESFIPALRDGPANWRSVHFSSVAAPAAANESGNNRENTKFLYLTLLTFVPITACADRLVQSSQTNAFAWKDIR